jgi:hypothetical protein
VDFDPDEILLAGNPEVYIDVAEDVCRLCLRSLLAGLRRQERHKRQRRT